MASAERFCLFPCSVIHGAAQTLNFAQIQDFAVNPNGTIDEFYAPGSVDRKANILANASPHITFGTQDLVTYFGAISPIVGLALTGAGTFRIQERSNLDGVFETGATHETFTATGGLIVPTRLTASQDEQTGCVMQSMFHALYNGSVEPIVHNTGVDFAGAPAPAFVSEFFLGPVYHNAAQVKGITQVAVDFGIQFVPKRTSGEVWATLGAITRRSPLFTFTTLKSDVDATISLFNRALSGVFAFYLWKGADAGSRVAIASTVHCKISCATGAWSTDSIQVTGHDDATSNISIRNTGVISVSVASAIP